MDHRSAKSRAPLLAPPRNGEAAREGFCQFLRAERERAALTIEEIARVTRIPEHSLRRLEAGEFEDLPADVFVRGFLRSYARCVGVDADEVVRRYAACGGLAPAPVASDLARVAAEQAAAIAEREYRDEEASALPAASDAPATATATMAEGEQRTEAGAVSRSAWGETSRGQVEASVWSIAPRDRSRDSGKMARGAPAAAAVEVCDTDAARRLLLELRRAVSRGPFALGIAVIVLVVAAIMTMSHLLRRPAENPSQAGATSSASSGSGTSP